MTKKNTQPRSPFIRALEPRLLFDGAAAGTAADTATDQVFAADHGDAASANHDANTPPAAQSPVARALEASRAARADQGAAQGRTAVFIDAETAASDAAGVDAARQQSDVDVYVVEPAEDGVAAISDAVEEQGGYDRITVIGRGTGDGDTVALGTASLSADGADAGDAWWGEGTLTVYDQADLAQASDGEFVDSGWMENNAVEPTFVLQTQDGDDTTSANDDVAAESGLANAGSKSVVFVDTSIENYESLIEQVNSDAEIALIDSQRDGVSQISEYLAGREGIEAIHIVSHGREGALSLGTATLDSASINGAYADELEAIGASLSESGDILIYGCDFTGGEEGAAAAALLAERTGADIAASNDDTGHASLNSDWDLETHVGDIDADAIAATGWHGRLAPSISLDFSDTPELVSGNDRQAGAVYRFSNVADGIDAVVTIDSIAPNTVITTFDSNTGVPSEGFSPRIQHEGNQVGYAQFSIDFVDAGTNDARVVSFTASELDLDSTTEYVQFGGASNFTVERDSAVSVSIDGETGTLTAQGSGNGVGGSRADTRNIVSADYTDVTGFKFGAGANNNTTRFYSLLFEDINTGDPADISYVDPVVVELPAASNDQVVTSENTPVTFQPQVNDGLGEGPTTISQVNGQAITAGGPPVTVGNGTVELNADGELTYTPNTDFGGTDTFTYTIQDANGRTSTATVEAVIDNDRDGVANVDDIDDDNDGILDTDEGYEPPVQTGEWEVAPGGQSATMDLGNGVIVRATGSGTDAFGNTSNFNEGGDGFWSKDLSGDVSLSTVFSNADSITFSFEDADGNLVEVRDPIVHMDRIGGLDGNGVQNSQILTLDDGLTWTTLAGTDDFGADANSVQDSGAGTQAANDWSASSSQNDLSGTAAGSLRVDGLISSFTINTTGGARDGVGFIIEAKPTPVDSDGDGKADHLDIDKDNDGITDNVEAQATADYVAPSGVGGTAAFLDANGDGLDDNYAGGLTEVDTDGDDTVDTLDADSDDDGQLDIDEAGHADTTLTGADSDGDGLDDVFDTAAGFDVNDNNIAGDNGGADGDYSNFALPDSDDDTNAEEPVVNRTSNDAIPELADVDFRDNASPEPTADTDTTDEDTQLDVDAASGLLANDAGVAGQPLNVTSFTVDGQDVTVDPLAGGSANIAGVGALTIRADGSYTFTPVTNYNGPVPQVTYTVVAGNAGTATSTFDITVDPVNDAPVAVADANTTNTAAAISRDAATGVLSNDTDVDDAVLTVSQVSGVDGNVGQSVQGSAGGQFVINADGSYTFDPNGDFGDLLVAGQSRTTTVEYQVSDGNGGFDTAELAVVVTLDASQVNQAPAAGDDSDATDEGVAIDRDAAAGVLGNDVDPNGDDLTVSQVEGDPLSVGNAVPGTNGGQFTLNADGSYNFTPGAAFEDLSVNETRDTSITYQVSDGRGGFDVARLTVTVTGVNDAPTVDVALDDVTSNDGETVSIPTSGAFADTDANDTLTYSAAGLPAGLSIDADTGLITGTLATDASQNGPYTITVTADDGNGGTISDSFDWTVNNQDPVAQADSDATDENVTITRDAANGVLANDQDTGPDADPLIVSQVEGDAGGVGNGVAGDAGGQFTLNEDGSYSFAPGADFDYLSADETVDTSITYQISDGQGGFDTARLTVTVTGVNDAPTVDVALDDVTSNDGETVSIPTSGAFADADANDTLTYSAAGLPAGLSIDADTGLITGTLATDASQNGPYTITVTADDGNGGTISDSFDLTALNRPTVAFDDADATTENTPIDLADGGNVLDNDDDPDGDPFTVSQVDGSADNVAAATAGTNGGQFTINADGTYAFDPAADFDYLAADETAETSITYQVSDGQGGFDTARLTVTVTGVNDAPTVDVALDDVTSNDGETVSIPTSGAFADTDANDTLTYSAAGLPAGLSIDADTGLITGTLATDASQNGPYTITVTADDGNGGTISDSFDWTVNNQDPVAQADSDATDENVTITRDAANGVLANDQDTGPDADPLIVSQVEGDAGGVGNGVAGDAGGQFTLNEDGSYSFAPGADFDYLSADETVDTSITYQISDGQGGFDTARLTVTVTGVNDAPTVDVALDDVTSNDGETVSIPTSGAFADADANDTLTYSAAGLPAGLSIDADTGLITGTLATDASQNGPYTITVTADDGNGGTISDSFDLTALNQEPTAVDDLDSTEENAALAGDVLANDSDGGTDTDTLTVNQVNGAVAGVGNPVAGTAGGQFTIDSDGTYSFEPGAAFDDLAVGETRLTSVTYQIDDGNGGTDTATLNVMVNGTNDGPVAVADTNTTTENIAVSGDVLANDTDVDASDVLAVSQVNGDPNGVGTPVQAIGGGEFTINGDGTYSFDPNGDFDDLAVGESRTTQVNYQVDDGNGGLATTTLTVTVNGSNDAPVAVADTNATTENVAASGDVLANDTDVDASDVLTVTQVNGNTAGVGAAVDVASGGRFTINADGSYDFDPDGDFDDLAVGESRTTQVNYQVDDGNGGTDTATLTVTVNGTNDVPVAAADANATSENVSASGNVLANDTDADVNDTLAVSQVNGDPNGVGSPVDAVDGGQFTINADGSYDFDPDGDFDDLAVGESRTTTISYQVSDGNGGFDTAVLTVTVNGTNDAPVANADSNATSENVAVSGDVLANDADADVTDTLVVSQVNGDPNGVGSPVDAVDGGQFTINADGSYDFDPNGDFDDLAVGESATTTVSYQVSDGNGGFDTAVLTVTVNGTNDAPVAVADTNTASEDAVASGDVLANDTDVDASDVLVVSQVNGDPAGVGSPVNAVNGGQFTVNADGSYDFDPNGDFDDLAVGESRTSTVTYQVSDGNGGTDTTTLTVTVTGANDAPVVTAPLADQDANDGDTVAISTAGAFTDTDTNDTLTYSAEGLPDGLQIDPDTGLITGALAADASQDGPYTITVTANDGNGGTVSDSFDLTAANVAPTAGEDTASVDENGSATGNVLVNDVDGGNDTDPLTVSQINGDPASVGTPVDVATGGRFTINTDGSYSFDTDGDFDDLAVGESRTTTITYQVSDSNGGTETATLTVTVNGANDGPVAVADTNTTSENVVANGDVLVNDTDADGSDILTVAQVNGDSASVGVPVDAADGGQFTVNADGSYSFDPGADFDDLAVGESRTTTVDYQVTDSNGGIDTTTLTVTVTGTNDAPVVSTPLENQTANDGDSVSVPTADAFTDVDTNDTLTYSAAGLPDGLAIDPATGLISGILGADASQDGPYTITVTADDGNGGTVDSNFVLQVNNVPPVATDDVASTPENALTSGNVLANDTDGDNDPLTVTQINGDEAGVGSPIAGANGGQFTVNADGSYDFDPGADFDDLAVGESRTTSVNYQVSDGNGGVDTAVLTITVNGRNDGPTAVADTATTDERTAASGNVLGNDADPDASDILTVAQVNGVSASVGVPVAGSDGGQFTINADGSYDFQPNGAFDDLAAGESRTTAVSYQADDGNGGTSTTTLTITVNGVNNAPVAAADSDSVTENAVTDGNVLTNDTDADVNDELTVAQVNGDAGNLGTPVAGVGGGQFTVNGDGTYSFDPNGDFDDLAVGETATTTVNYQVSDGNGGTDTATLTVTVNGTNDVPTAGDDVVTTVENTPVTGNVLANDADPDANDILTVAQVGGDAGNVGTPTVGANGGQFTVNSDGTYSFDPNGDFDDLAVGESATTTISYQVSDGNGGTDTATITVTVNGANDAPVAAADSDTVTENAVTDGNVLTNDTDADGNDTLTVSQINGDPASVGTPVAAVGGGQFTVNGDGTYSFDPNGDFDDLAVGESRTTRVNYQVSDGNGGTDTAVLTVTVNGTNDVPVGNDDVATANENTPATGNVLANDTDVDLNDTLAVSQVNGDPAGVGTPVDSATGGQFTINADGSYSFDPNGDFDDLAIGESRTTTISYQVSDGNGGTDTATITVTVNGANDAPIVDTPLSAQASNDGDTVSVATADSFTDVDGDPLTYSATNLPPGLSIDADTGEISGTIDNDASVNVAQDYNVTVTATDPSGQRDSSDFVWTVSNLAPTTADDVDNVAEDASITRDASAGVLANDSDTGTDTDPLIVGQINGDAASVGAPVRGDNGGQFTVNADGSYTFASNGDFEDLGVGESRTSSVTYQADDGNGGTQTATLTVTVAGANDAPVVDAPLSPQTANDGETVSVPTAGAFTDADANDVLTYSAGNTLPPGLSINPATGEITGTIDGDASADGPYEVTITATDQSDESVSSTFTWTVNNLDPVANNDNDEATEGATINRDAGAGVLANDGDAGTDTDLLNVSEVNGESGNVGAPVTGTNGGQFTVRADGSYDFATGADFEDLAVGETRETTLTYTADDGNGGTDTATLTVVVTGTNDGPVVDAPLPDRSSNDGKDVSIDASAAFTDVDGDTLSYSVTGLPEGLVIDPDTGIISGRIANDASQIGSYDVTVTATDPSNEAITSSFVWTVNNLAPMATNDTDTTTENVVVSSAPGAGVLANDGDTETDFDDLTVSRVNGDAGAVGAPVTGANGGQFTINEDGSYEFDPNGDFDDLAVGESRSSSVTYQADDGDGGVATATFTVTVTGTNDGPVAAADSDSVTENAVTDGNVLTNDTDADVNDELTVAQVNGDPASVGTPVAGANGGQFTVNGDGTYSFDPNGDFDDLAVGESATTTVEYQVTDGNGGTDTATLTVTVNGTNDVPVAGDDAVTTDENVAANGNVLGNDTDTDGNDVLTVAQVGGDAGNVGTPTAGANGGQFTIGPDGTYSFEPGTDFDDLAIGESRTTTISYQVSDGNGGTDTATLTVTVNGTNDGPVAAADSDSVTENAVTDGNVLTNDTDADVNDELTVAQVNGDPASVGTPVAGANSGQFTVNGDGTYSFDPNGDFDDLAVGESATTTVEYQVTDGNGGMDTATLTVTVNGTNDVPVAGDDAVTTDENVAANGNVLGNDTDTDGNDVLTVAQVGGDAGNVGTPTAGANGGQFTIGPDGTYSFEPGTDFDDLAIGESRTTTISYQVSDGNGGTDTATLTVTVNGTNDGPVAAADSDSVTENAVTDGNVLTNDTDADVNDELTVAQVNGDPASVGTPVAGANGGQFTVNGDGTYSFDPNGDFDDLAVGESATTTVEYQVTDGNGGTDTATLTVTVNGTNDVPVAGDDAVTTDENVAANGNVLGNDTDTDGNDVLTVAQVGGDAGNVGTPTAGANGGQFTIGPDGTYSFEPGADFDDLAIGESRTTTISYQVSDGNGGTDTATLTVTVNGTNDGPVVDTPLNDQVADDGDTVSISTAGAFNDPDGEALTYSADGLPAGLSIDPATGLVTGTLAPDASQDGPYNITVTATDPNGSTVSDSFLLTPANVAPVAGEDAVSADENTPATGNVLANDTDGGSDSDPLTVSQVDGDPAGVGTPVTAANGGQFTINADGTYSFDPNGDFDDLAVGESRTTTVRYQVADGNGGFDTATLTVTVNGSNDVPVANDDVVSADENTPVTGNALANDTDTDTNDDLSVAQVDGDADNVGTPTAGSDGGQFTINADGTYSFDPNGEFGDLGAGESRTTTISYQVSDGNGGTDTATITVTVNGLNQGPSAGDITDGQTPFGSDYSNDVSDAFADNDLNDTLTYGAEGLPAGLSIDPDTGVISGEPVGIGAFDITVTATDSTGAQVSETFTLRVLPPAVAADIANVGAPAGPSSSAAFGGGSTLVSGGFIGYSSPMDTSISRVELTIPDGIDNDPLSLGLPDGPIASSVEPVNLRYQATESDGSPLPGTLTVNSSTGELTGSLPPGMDRARITVIAIDDNGNTRPQEVWVDANGNILEAGANARDDAAPLEYRRVEVRVGIDGQVIVESVDDAGNTMRAESIRVDGNYLDIQIFDPESSDVSGYTATLSNGDPLPEGLAVDRDTGRITGEVPAGLDTLSLRIEAQTADNVTRVLEIEIDRSGARGDSTAWQSLDAQVQQALASSGDVGEAAHGARIAAALRFN